MKYRPMSPDNEPLVGRWRSRCLIMHLQPTNYGSEIGGGKSKCEIVAYLPIRSRGTYPPPHANWSTDCIDTFTSLYQRLLEYAREMEWCTIAFLLPGLAVATINAAGLSCRDSTDRNVMPSHTPCHKHNPIPTTHLCLLAREVSYNLKITSESLTESHCQQQSVSVKGINRHPSDRFGTLL